MLEKLRNERLKKLELLRSGGVDPFPSVARRDVALGDAVRSFAVLAKKKKRMTIAGRIVGLRDQGKVLFADVRDATGALQAVLKSDALKNFALLKSVLDRGDIVSVSGTLFITSRGEKSIEAKQVDILAKSLLPIPTEFYGLKDKETLLRKRYLEFVVRPEFKELFKKKAAFWSATRRALEGEGFLEVETPILELVPGGAEAEPFITRYNALDEEVYLRISPELALKRLMVAGFEKIFEIGRVFRNEGIDAEHLQDYTQVELYWAYQNHEGLMKFLETMIKGVIKETFGTLAIAHGGKKVNWGKKWASYDYVELFRKATKLDLEKVSKEELLQKAHELGIVQATKALGRGKLIDLIYKKTIRPTLIEPGFLVYPPVDVEPLAKRKPDEPWRALRFQLVAYGTELGKGFSELNDPLDQRERFEEQMRLRAAGDKEAQMIDEDYVEAMEYGMPPAAGFGMSERLFAVLADFPVRETVLFPLTRRKE